MPLDILSARPMMQGALQSTIVPAGYLLGLETLGEAMKDKEVRQFFGHTLLHEIMPCVDLPKGELEPLAMALCREMEGPLARQPLLSFLQNGIRAWAAQVLPILEAYEKKNFALPPCLCFGLSVLIMFYAGARKNAEGAYEGVREGKTYPVEESEETLLAFSRFSCDMPPEMLAYAVLSDQDIWEKDLREIEGLETLIAGQLQDLQLIGLRAAMEKAWKMEAEMEG